mgnify:FL=1
MKNHLFVYLRPYRTQLILGPSLKLVEAILELMLPYMLANIIDLGILKHNKTYIYHEGVKMLIIIAVGLICAISCQYLASLASQGFGKKVRSALFGHVNKLSLAELDALGADTLTTRISSDINQLQIAVSMLIRLISRAPFVCVGCIVAAMLIDLPLSAVIWIGVIAFIVVLASIMMVAFPMYAVVQQNLDALGGVVLESLSGARVIRAFARGGEELRRFATAVNRHAAKVIRVTRVSALMNPITGLIMNLVICAILWFGAIRVGNGEMKPGEIVAFINYIAQILVALIAVANLIIIFTKAYASYNRVNAVFDYESSLQKRDLPDPSVDGKDSPEASPEKDAITFAQVSFSYVDNPEKDPEKYAVKDLDFAIPVGTVFGIIGGTGSGKTTIMSLIARFYDVSEGAIQMQGRDIRTMSPKEVQKKISCVFQSPILFSGSIAENLCLGAPEATYGEIREACRIAQADKFIEEMPDSYRSVASRGGTNFSGGQKQRLSIARALVRQTPILILDDAFSALDYQTEARLRCSLLELQRATGTTIIMISQRISSIRTAEQILVMEDGRQIAVGRHEELLKTCEEYRAIAQSQLAPEEVQ